MSGGDKTMRELKEAFSALNQSTEKLTEAYVKLSEETAGLKADLEESGEFLNDILGSLHCGVVVTGPGGEVVMANREAQNLEVADGKLVAQWLSKLAEPAAKAAGRIEWEAPGGRIFSISVSPLEGRGKERNGVVLVIDEVTELEKLRKQSKRGDRLRAIGELAAGMAHEIRNPLGGMDIFASLLRRELEGDEDRLKLVNHISSGIKSINNVISNFLLFTKEITPAKKKFDLNKLLADIMEFTKYVMENAKVQGEAFCPDGDVTLFADPELLRQAVLNLIQNSMQAMPDGGRISIGLTKTVNGPAEKVEISVGDSGPGVPLEIREKIFDPFFTTKESGAGLGLSIASQIAQAHGGYIDYVESPEGGSKFVISLPV